MRVSHNARVLAAPPFDNAYDAHDADEALMLRYAGGDMAAFERLYARHELAVWPFVFRSVKLQAVADDLLPDVWFAVARNASRYEVEAKFRTWLFTLAHNRLVDHLRTPNTTPAWMRATTMRARWPTRWWLIRALGPCGNCSRASRRPR